MLHRSTTFLLSILFALLGSLAVAQETVREAPQGVRVGRLVANHEEVRLDGVPDRLSPRARLHGPQGQPTRVNAVWGREVPVLYRRDARGQLDQLWLLTEAEYKRLGPAATGAAEFDKLVAQIFNERIAR